LAPIDAFWHGGGEGGQRTDAGLVGGRSPRAMIATLETFAQVVATPVHVKRTLPIAFVVGSCLNLFNHGDELLRGACTAALAVKLVLNCVTPVIVSNFGLRAHQHH
jgi:hypothetical protein